MFTYNCAEVKLYINNVPLMQYSKDEFLKISPRNAPSFKLKTGCDRETTVLGNADKSGTIDLSLMQGSKAYSEIQKFIMAAEIGNKSPFFYALVKDNNEEILFDSENAFFEKPAEAGYSTLLGKRDLRIICPFLNISTNVS